MTSRNSKIVGGHDEEAYSECLYCNKCESDDVDWVQCKTCERWAHFSCAGVDESVVEVEWECSRCDRPVDQQLTVPKTSKTRSKTRAGSKSEGGSVRGNGSVSELTDQQFEEEQLARERAFAKQMEIRESRLRREMEWNAKQLEMERNMRKRELEVQRMMQEEKLKQEQDLLNAQLADEQAFLKQRNEIRSKLNSSIQKVKSYMNEEGAVGGTSEQTPNKVTSWLHSQRKSVTNRTANRGAVEKVENPLVRPSLSVAEDEVSQYDDSDSDGDGRQDSDKSESIGKNSLAAGESHRSQSGFESQAFRLTREQIATRKVISGHLPKFNGDPETWPLFISSFENTTRACGYSNIENLDRLLNSLGGEALNAVRSMLVLPDSVPEVIRDLRRLFGQPEKLLRTLLNKVKNAPPPTTEDLKTFVRFGITVKQLCDHLEAAHLSDHLRNPLLVQQLVEKLQPEYQMKWVEYKRGRKGTPLRLFTDFITGIGDVASEAVAYSLTTNDTARHSRVKPARKNEFLHVHDSASKCDDRTFTGKANKPCWICNRTDHLIRFCEDFRRMNVGERLKAVEKQKLCGVCLNKHGDNACGSKARCTVKNCKGNHHTLLHRVEESVQLQRVECNTHGGLDRSVIFRMAPISLYAGNKRYDTLAFLDEGSSTTLVNEAVADRLKAEGETEPLIVTWTGNINRFENNSRKVELTLSVKGSKEKIPLENVRTVSELLLPKQHMRFADVAKQYPHLAGLPVRDHPTGQAAILIGLDNLHLFAPLESRVGKQNEPIAVRSRIGWTVYGPEKRKPSASTFLNLHTVSPVSNQDFHDLMRNQYILDEAVVSSFPIPEPKEEQRAKAILRATTKRLGERFETGLLWREDERRFPDNYAMALRRMKALERKLERDPALKENVCQQIVDYQEKGYAHRITKVELTQTPSSAVWYLPLNAVVNPRKPGKVRLVWDAAASVRGISLNTELLKGPDMLIPLPRVICRFRERPVAFGGDIQEMYHQIRIRSEDKQAQRFLFRSNSAETPQVYVMDVATFGSTCSPCSAQYVKNLNAEQFSGQFPEAAIAVSEKHYVDDYYDSVDTVEEAMQRAKEVKYIHSQGGFHIRNWVSSSHEFLEAMGERNTNDAVHFNRDKSAEYERVLGIVWEPVEDSFCFASVSTAAFRSVLDGDERPTKRSVLSFVMAQFDPTGLISPITVRGKMLIQDLWRTGCDWDTKIDAESFDKWRRWIGMMRNIKSFKISRSYFGDAKSTEIQELELHIMADASEKAYGCVAYFRAVVRGEVRCALVMSRSKVAPLKQVSIPRLELLAAVLAARLSRTVIENHSLVVGRVVFWVDASVVLSWIRSDQRRYKQFVGFRIGEILSLTKLTEWRWVPTRMNVADQLTKWGKDPEMHPGSAWVRGPSFLYENEEKWPKKELPPSNTTEELRIHLLLHNVKVQTILIDAGRISKWTVLVRTMACVFRFISNCRRKCKGLPIKTLKPTKLQAKMLKQNAVVCTIVPLQQEEYDMAEKCLLRMAQAESFIDELKLLKRNENRPVSQWLEIDKSSPLRKLTPLIDEAGLIRMEGRCAQAEDLPFDLRFPVILPDDSRITNLIVQHVHEKCGHGYRQTVKNKLRQLFHIIHMDAVVKKVSSACMWCKVNRNRPRVPREAPLPVQRLTPSLRPFSFVGVDYMGPFEVTVGRRREKRWIALFTCLVTRAVHLEVVHGLTTQSCLMAINRFIGRRDWPIEFLSDNGTNFQGASKELAALIKDIEFDCADEYTNAKTKWTFNPPASPHMGGVWERLVRSVKEALKSLHDGRRLTDEILQTVIVEAEDMINSRPLAYTSQESEEAEALTPNHFLRGPPSKRQDVGIPPANPSEALRDAYKRSQQLAGEMWQRWIREYVPTLNQRTKWFGETKPLKAGDLVYIVEGNNRKCWVRGIVEEPIISRDGRIRQAWVRTRTKRYKRAVANLAVLELEVGNTEPKVTSGPGLRAGEYVGNTANLLPSDA
ncbi:uncharacterized protein LOC129720345 [Wyeomyia smithii]|uniref:uncharacterized protein LOC129720345 n=1 Tax=Wyeomyia smithii TaxID=174621 RepID=UPI002467F001|nr:uncharacterized protein LOC129720345 [Wyeomyia smithii]